MNINLIKRNNSNKIKKHTININDISSASKETMIATSIIEAIFR